MLSKLLVTFSPNCIPNSSILSSFLKDSVDQDGLSNELMDSFMENRSGLFSERFLRQWDMSPDKYIKLRHKQLK